MIGSLKFAVLLAVIVCAVPAVSATYVVWQGNAIVTSASASCFSGTSERGRIRRGDVLKSVVRPRLIADNGNNSRVAFIHNGQSEFALVLAGGLTIATQGTYAAYGVTASGAFKTNVGGTYQNFTLTPSTPGVTDTFLTLGGTVNNFMFIDGCTVTFRAGYSLRP